LSAKSKKEPRIPGCKTIEIFLKVAIFVKIKIARIINEKPSKIASTRLAKDAACEIRTRDPAVNVARYAMPNVNAGVRYHCGETLVERLKRESRVATTAYWPAKMVRTLFML